MTVTTVLASWHWSWRSWRHDLKARLLKIRTLLGIEWVQPQRVKRWNWLLRHGFAKRVKVGSVLGSRGRVSWKADAW